MVKSDHINITSDDDAANGYTQTPHCYYYTCSVLFSLLLLLLFLLSFSTEI